jgi:ATP-dependent DNA helicase RecG
MMEMAVDAMRASRPEPKDDGSAPLYVGASALFPDGRVDSASRGEFRYGDHAEYTLLERKHPTDVFDGATVFSTLEPCAGEHARNERKTPCAQRLIEARVARVFMGIQDPDPTIGDVGRKALEKAGIEVLLFPPDLQAEIAAQNQAWIGQADRRAALVRDADAFLVPGAGTRKILMAAQGATFDDLDTAALAAWRAVAMPEAKSNKNPDFLVGLAQTGWLAVRDDDKRTYVPTRLGMLLLGKKPRLKRNPHFLIKGAYDYGDGRPAATLDYEGALLLFPEALRAWLDETLPAGIMLTSSVLREDFKTLVTPWIREAVFNAVIHRDYDDESGKVSFEISRDAITVVSPGGPPEIVGLERLRELRAPSYSVNPSVHMALNKMRAGEERGFGMKAFAGVSDAGFPKPVYTYEPPYLKLTIALTQSAATAAQIEILDPATTGHLPIAERLALVYFAAHPRATNDEVGQAVGFENATAVERAIRRLDTVERLIDRTGPPRSRVVTLTEKATR